MQKTPSSKSYPPVVLVQTWIAISNQTDEEDRYARSRAIDLINLVFGSMEFAERYVSNNLKPSDNEQKANEQEAIAN